MINDDRKRFYKQQLRQLATATGWLARPEELAQRINEHIVKREPELIRAVVASRFATEGKSSGESWRPLALRTAIQRQKQGFGAWNPILRRSGLLMRAAVGGTLAAFPNRIEITFKDGPAPKYSRKGKFTKKRVRYFMHNEKGESVWIRKRAFNLLQGERNLKFGATGIGKIGSLMDYADQLNQVRPFYGRPTEQETIPVRARAREILCEVLRRVACGQAAGI